jgi:hypothetical protein
MQLKVCLEAPPANERGRAKKQRLNAESNRENDLMTAYGNSFLRIFSKVTCKRKKERGS